MVLPELDTITTVHLPPEIDFLKVVLADLYVLNSSIKQYTAANSRADCNLIIDKIKTRISDIG